MVYNQIDREVIGLKIKKKNLLLLAGIVWLIAGGNVLYIGIEEYQEHLSFLNIVLSLVTFLAFFFMIFYHMAMKHTLRITSYLETHKYFWMFFDLKSFAIMAFMIIMGVSLRSFNLVPEVFIAFFYTGLGTALAMAGVLFLYNFFTLPNPSV